MSRRRPSGHFSDDLGEILLNAFPVSPLLGDDLGDRPASQGDQSDAQLPTPANFKSPRNHVARRQADPFMGSPRFLMFAHEDWTLFRALSTLAQKAGVPEELIPTLVLKELVDNALDSGAGDVQLGTLPGGGHFVEDDGPGIPGEPEDVAALFSIRRALLSSKLLRRPTRGALGNGLRVVTGAVVATGGELRVCTNGRRLRLEPGEDGTTRAIVEGTYRGTGTRVEIALGGRLRSALHADTWARQALMLASPGSEYRGRSSPYWYTSEAFYELCQAAQGRTVRDLVSELDGCSGAKAGLIAAPYKGRLATSLERSEVDVLLATARANAKPVKPARLGAVDGLPDLGSHAKCRGTFNVSASRGKHAATIPFVVEAWAMPASERSVAMHVNRTPVTTPMKTFQDPDRRTDTALIGCNLRDTFATGREPMAFYLNITTPYLALTSDGKAPDLLPMRDEILATLEKAARRARRGRSLGSTTTTQKEATLAALVDAVEKVSGGGQHRFSQRQLYYAIRPFVMHETGSEVTYGHFEKIITDYERDIAPVDGMYRDSRGILYHPHVREELPVGTLSIERYKRPPWTFSRVLYCEKEGLFQVLIDSKWPERHDCALLTSKGFASRAARDLLDLLGDDESEPVTFYCIHDADGPGTMIYEALQDGTAARPGRLAHIVNLGLEPDDATAMGLEVEAFERKGSVAVAQYVGPMWRQWLQTQRVELNAMSTPQFLEWLTERFEQFEKGKLVPPPGVMQQTLRDDLTVRMREQVVERLLEDAKAEEKVAKAIRALEPVVKQQLRRLSARVRRDLERTPDQHWSVPVAEVVREVLDRAASNTTFARRPTKKR